MILFPTCLDPLIWVDLLTDVLVYPGWQSPQSRFTWFLFECFPELGGEPWHEPQAVWLDPPTQDGAVLVPPSRVAPWQYVEHVPAVSFQDAVVPCAPSPVIVTTGVPFTCERFVGTVWHAEQATADPIVPPARCFAWAPTATSVVAVVPWVPTGGAAELRLALE